MGEQETFKLIYDSLVDFHKAYVTNVMNTLAFIVIATGWILTSDKSRDYLSRNKTGRWVSLFVIVIIAVIHTVVSVGLYQVSPV